MLYTIYILLVICWKIYERVPCVRRMRVSAATPLMDRIHFPFHIKVWQILKRSFSATHGNFCVRNNGKKSENEDEDEMGKKEIIRKEKKATATTDTIFYYYIILFIITMIDYNYFEAY